MTRAPPQLDRPNSSWSLYFNVSYSIQVEDSLYISLFVECFSNQQLAKVVEGQVIP